MCRNPVPDITVRQLKEGDRVKARYYIGNKSSSWKIGTIVKKLGNIHYVVRLDNGFVFKRHINQLCLTEVQISEAERSRQSDSEVENRSGILGEPQVNVRPAGNGDHHVITRIISDINLSSDLCTFLKWGRTVITIHRFYDMATPPSAVNLKLSLIHLTSMLILDITSSTSILYY